MRIQRGSKGGGSRIAPFIIGIGGGESGSGKTTVACRLLESLKGWGALKCTPVQLYSSVIDDPVILRQKGKDTERFLRAGAEDVLWVQSPAESLTETLGIAVGRLSHLKGIIVEGNSAIEVLRADIVIFISGGPDKLKKSALNILSRADLVIFDREPPEGTPAGAEKFHQDDIQGYVNCITGIIDGRKD